MIHFDIVVAHDLNNGIGKDNTLVWKLPEDMARFKKITTSTQDEMKQNVVIMGRKTYESIPKKFRPLPNRINLVISRTKVYKEDNTHCCSSIEQALEKSNQLHSEQTIERIFCIGGSQLYREMITHPLCNHLYITKIHKTFNCDAFFPSYTDTFKCIESQSNKLSQNETLSYQFQTWSKQN